MPDTKQQSIEEVGEKTLDIIGGADKFNNWIYKTILPFCSGNVIEIGSGLGNISGLFLNDSASIMLTDIREEYCIKLHNKFDGFKSLLGIENVDLADPYFDEKHIKLFSSFDTVFAINVIEHISDDSLAVKNCLKLLKTGGNLIVLVPSYQKLFNDFDRSLGHYRRYDLKSATELLASNNLCIIHRQYFNFAGIIGWFISGSIQKHQSIPQNQMKLYNRFVNVFRLIDALVFRSFGLSSIVVGKKCTWNRGVIVKRGFLYLTSDEKQR
jgi:SAM-dependent methyltransferase